MEDGDTIGNRNAELVAQPAWPARPRGCATLGELGHLVLLEAGILVFADYLEQPITLQASSTLLKDGGALSMGSESCPYYPKAVISLYDKASKGNGVESYGKKFLGVGRASEMHQSDRGLNVRIVITDTTWVVLPVTSIPTTLRMKTRGYGNLFPPGKVVAIAVGDSVGDT
ncbi:UNVERIFIED_CONTAM: hypothetical protein K2H54_019946 [Gekko kuhli]